MYNVVKEIETFNIKKDHLIHMRIAGRVKNILKNIYGGAIDTIGEGAAIYSRMIEDEVPNIIGGKASYSAEGLSDLSGEHGFANMRAYLCWAIRDALDPAFGFNLMLPPDDELAQELTEIHWDVTSTGKIQIEKKKLIKKAIGRSPDKSDALALSFYPVTAGDNMPEVIGDYEI